jgi:hypothetical protein
MRINAKDLNYNCKIAEVKELIRKTTFIDFLEEFAI